jgi:hypothetical protein
MDSMCILSEQSSALLLCLGRTNRLPVLKQAPCDHAVSDSVVTVMVTITAKGCWGAPMWLCFIFPERCTHNLQR